ncbi:hypothetical protein BZA05DRAFT_415906 [Tricharina praecox]|uniref:uncharacterized protein n=1 Tax=Tricharina praecox TaxID=43433 RepID=UPI00222065BF|nr:uncharacterized protein BZA05DRAFT_415906 [Tricharina praecox]KAI5857237.1 hypothetical protein BZA05DRAFT_415906 [Tricharina praecox]
MALFPSSFPFPSLSLPPRVVNVCVFLLCHGARNAYLPRQLPYRVHGREANASDKDDGSSAASDPVPIESEFVSRRTVKAEAVVASTRRYRRRRLSLDGVGVTSGEAADMDVSIETVLVHVHIWVYMIYVNATVSGQWLTVSGLLVGKMLLRTSKPATIMERSEARDGHEIL